jgi:hypothetical protein
MILSERDLSQAMAVWFLWMGSVRAAIIVEVKE